MEGGNSLEKNLRKQLRISAFRRAVLATIAVAGAIPIAVVAPNVLAALGSFEKKYTRQKQYQTKQVISHLIEKGYITTEKTSDDTRLILTKRGKAFITQQEVLNYKIKKPKHWDKRWRVVIFDIPEKYRKSRTNIRVTLSRLGFMRLQDSVWIYPYDCEELIFLLKTELKLGKNLLYLIVEHMENDKYLRSHFNLTN